MWSGPGLDHVCEIEAFSGTRVGEAAGDFVESGKMWELTVRASWL
jgi:hypothetical protein